MENRPITITVASLAFIIFGAVNIAYAVLLGVFLSSSTSLSQGGLVAGALVVLIMVLGILDIISGYGLWYMKRWGAIMGMLIAMLGLISQNLFYSLILSAGYTLYSLSLSSASIGTPWVDILLVILIAISWRSFESTAA